MQITHKYITDRKFDDVLSDLVHLAEANRFRVLGVHDLQADLAEKGYDISRFKIVEICNSKLAYEALGLSRDISVFMPCRISIYAKNDKTAISTMKPRLMAEFFDDHQLQKLALLLDRTVTSMLKRVARGDEV